jgi:beta-glucosidase
MRNIYGTSLLLLAGVIAAAAQTTSGWQLVWSDEFNGAAGTAPDPAKWNFDLGGGGWGNGELEVYTNSINNAFQDGNGNLVIRVIKNAQGGYTSARLQTGSPGASTHTTDGSWQYGRIEARIKLPFGKGVWPAFWMLGEDISTTPWPASGEVDIMENFGTLNNNANVNNGTAHGPGYSGAGGLGAPYTLPFGETVYDDYHVYAIEWSPNSIVWFVDGASYHTVTPASLPSGTQWVFNAPFFLLLNLAIGGPSTFLGTPDASVTFPQDLLVDYVRVYQTTPIQTTTPVIAPGRVLNVASYLGAISPGSLAAVYGNNLADGVHTTQQPDGSFPSSAAGVTVSVNGVNAPLIYVSPTQINFQIPWETAPGLAVPVKVTWNSVDSNVEPVTIAATASPSFFLSEFVNGVAWVTGGVADGCATPVTECSVKAGSIYQLWANGLGPKTSPLQDGVPAPPAALQVPGGPASCQLTIGGQPATVLYCGVAPGEIIDQVNFTYPSGVAAGSPYVGATLTVNGVTGHFRVPAPLTSDQRAGALVASMTQAQKLQLVNGAGGPVTNIIALPRGAGGYIPGIPALGIPALYFVDGSLGVADSSAPSTALPSALASAASWDTDLAYKFGSVIGAETAAWGLNVNLGGNINLIGREPRDGRTFETKGEDPILAGKITAAHIRAIQDKHVIGGAKHYALNDQETGRTFANVQIDERGARESDLLAFEIAVKDSNAQSVMCSYNQVNGVYSCENPHLLNDVLKKGWGFTGFVMSDWWATHSTAAAALAGLDQEQPDNANFGKLGQAVASGLVPQSRVDDMVHRILHAMFEVGLFDNPNAVTAIDTVTDQAIAQQAEEQGAVLLKNAGGQLPLDPAAVHSIAVIGWNANVGVLSGGGSAQVWPTGTPVLEGYPILPGWSRVVWDPSSPLDAIRAMAPNATVRFNNGSSATTLTALAATSDVAIVFVSQWTSEGMDTPSLNFTDVIHPAGPLDQDALVASVAAVNPHTIVVMENGGAQVMPWLPNVSAVLEAWFPGQKGGEAIANILFGAVNPSGKLPITFPASVADLPHPTIAGTPNASVPFPVSYSEGYLVGYKWYDSKGMTPLFPFGFGLSYTTFSLTGDVLNYLTTSTNSHSFQVSVLVRNTGAVAGAEVVQVYMGLPAATGEPPKRLVGWRKVFLQPGASAFVTVGVDENDSSHPMSYWDTNSSSWLTASGDYPVYVGNSSASASLTLAGTVHVGS